MTRRAMLGAMDKDQLRRRREALRLTQAQLAARFGVSLRTYQEWEHGQRPIRALVELALAAIANAGDNPPR